MDRLDTTIWTILKDLPLIAVWRGSDPVYITVLVALPLVIGGLLAQIRNRSIVKALIICMAVLTVFNNVFLIINGFSDTWYGLALFLGVPSFYMLAGLAAGSLIFRELSKRE